jgi:hypothetical protein
MFRESSAPGRASLRRRRSVFLLRAAGLCLCLTAAVWAQPDASASAAPALEAQTVLIDFVHSEAFKTSTWIHVSLPSSHVLLSNLRIITANRKWSLQICGSVSNPGSCVNALAGWDPRGVGWRGDFKAAGWSQDYQDLDATNQLHLKVTPQGGDWMIFRIQVGATPTP